MLVASGCGDDDDGESKSLSGEELQQARQSSDAIRGYCRDVAAFLAGRRERPTLAEADRTLAAADQLIRTARANPDAPFAGTQTMRDLVGDLTEDLEGTNCSPVLVRRLNDGFDTIPARKSVPSY